MKPIRLAILALLSLIPLAAWSAPETSVQVASSQFKQGQNQNALQSINAFLKDNPKDAQGRFLKGLILTELNRYPEAIKLFSDLTADYPDLPEPYNNLAVLHAAQGQYDQARNSLEMAIRTHPSYATAHENLGDIYAKMASLAYDKALQLDKANQSAQTKLSLIKDLFSPTVPTVSAAVPSKVASRTAPAKLGKSAGMTTTTTSPETPAAETKPGNVNKPTVASATVKTEVETALTAWATAWSKKDVSGYIASYSSQYTPAGIERATWETQRQERLGKPAWIKISFTNLEIEVNGQTATARFKQRYESDRHSDWSRKTLTFEQQNGSWKITGEQ